MMLSMRFDMRLVAGADPTEQYQAALDMAAYGEEHGAVAVVLSEHHASPDGYLPSPVPMAAAIAARTTSLRIIVAAAILPFYDPVRLAEDITIVHHLSRGRVSWVLALGYRPEEFEMFGIDPTNLAAIADDKLETLLAALEGQPFARDGRRVWVTPGLPAGRPSISWGGRSRAAARRAARFGLDFFGQTNTPGLEEAYREEAARVGRAPGNCMLPDPRTVANVFVAADVDAAWEELGPYLLHDATTYADWNAENPTSTASLSHGRTVEELRAEDSAHRIITIDEAAQLPMLSLHPLCGGIPPDVGWRYLKAAAELSSSP